MDESTDFGSRWHSMERRLPLMVCLLLLFVVGAVSVFAYLSLEGALVRDAEVHATTVAAELERLLETSTTSTVRQVREAAVLPEVAGVAAGSPGALEAAAEALGALATERSSIVGIAIRSTSPEWELWVDGPSVDSIPGPRQVTAAFPAGEEGSVGPLRASGSSIFYDAVVPLRAVPGGEQDPWQLIFRHRVASGDQARLLSGLIGEEALFLVGSDEPEGTWSDLARPVARPEPGVGSEFTWNEASYYGDTVNLAGAPWQVWVGMPRAQVLAPARSLAQSVALFGGMMLLLGTVGAWFLGRLVSRPVGRLTKAADRISSGAYGERVPVQGKGEIPRLAEAFNTMAAEIEAATGNLEDRVERRTRQLKDTLRELHEAQEQLVRREKLAILGQLASGVGHELRNPLGVMTNAVYYLEAVSPDARPEVAEYFGILRTQLGLAEKIVGDLLDFARVKPPDHAPVDLEVLLEEQLQRLGDLDAVRVERAYEENLPRAHVDRVQIGQVVFNLLTNALQAIDHEEGCLMLRTRKGPDGHVSLSVRDTGGGIAPENLGRVFEPLFTTKARGIGLGLSVSQSLAAANDGELSVESDPGKGTMFTLSLPAAT